VVFPSPFARAPHPLARAAAEQLMASLPASPREGKMYGVLVARARDGTQVILRGFSGMLDGSWLASGFVPPAFDMAARDAVWPAGERELADIAARLAAIDVSKVAALAAIDGRHAVELDALRARHREQREARRLARARIAHGSVDVTPALHALDQASRADSAEKRRLLDRHQAERAELASDVEVIERERRALEALRAARSRFYLHALYDTYALANARGERRPLREIFAPEEPPGGAGDCVAPKLLAEAYRRDLAPIAIAELWWGPPPATGGRAHAQFYPACRGKCGPVLGHMLGGLDVEPAPVFEKAIGDAEPRVVFEDRWFAVVDKPCGLLSVPGRSRRDSVQTRMERRSGAAYVVHRLDLDTSGLMVVAKDPTTYAALQRLFAERAVDKQYIAHLDGEVRGESGVVELPLRLDVEDRPRQVVDPMHGKPARTEWQILSRHTGVTVVRLVPRTGRTHQLRVHAAHVLGIGVPIVGDPLYGRPGARLHLHAAALSFVHPETRSVLAWRADPAF
jgi:tRNA pseudouridine32 synthase/23S rRNA pseudouridine746 synthase